MWLSLFLRQTETLMKAFIGPLFLSLILCSATFAQSPTKITKEELPEHFLDLASKFANDYLNRYNADSVYVFGDEATPEMKKALGPESPQKNANTQIRAAVGNFKSFDFAESWTQSGYTIIRYHAIFEKNDQAEIRVVLDGAGKVGGFLVRPWTDSLN